MVRLDMGIGLLRQHLRALAAVRVPSRRRRALDAVGRRSAGGEHGVLVRLRSLDRAVAMKRAALAAAFVLAALYLHSATPSMIYPDTRDYRQISRIPIGDLHFWHAVRPPMVPLFLKLS